jgi:ribonuclease T2
MIKLINLFLMVLPLPIHAMSSTNLDFQATKVCPAYLSKNQRTNPHNLMTKPNTRYSVREINKPVPNWLRIEMAGQHTLRWVSVECGVIQKNSLAGTACNHTGIADSYVLALSSQPGFCESYGYEAGRSECGHLSKDSYQAHHLTLHGLWPNIDTCGQHYGYCGVRPRAHHCDYDPVLLSPEVGDELKKIMPGFNSGSCLERHEWNKHGSCQTLSATDYFSLAIRLNKEADQSSLGQYLKTHQGQILKLSTLHEVVKQAFGSHNEGKIYFGCKNNILVDVFIQLPGRLPVADSLADLIDKAPKNQFKDLCRSSVKVSSFNKDSLL